MQTDKRFKRFSKGSELIQFAKTEAVIYTRVSTKEQADNNASLDTQLKHCKKYAEEKGLDVIEFLEERMKAQKMMSERNSKNAELRKAKKNNRICYCLFLRSI